MNEGGKKRTGPPRRMPVLPGGGDGSSAVADERPWWLLAAISAGVPASGPVDGNCRASGDASAGAG